MYLYHSPRGREINALRREIDALTEEGNALTAKLDLRYKQFLLFLHSIQELQSELAREAVEEERKARREKEEEKAREEEKERERSEK